MIRIFALLVFAHSLADYPLQGDFLSKAKNKWAPIAGVPWWQALGAHAVIHAGFVYIITGSLALALAEFVSHALIDHNKCAGRIGFNTDQLLHVGCKLAWAAIATLLI